VFKLQKSAFKKLKILYVRDVKCQQFQNLSCNFLLNKAKFYFIVLNVNDKNILFKKKKTMHELLNSKNRILVFSIFDKIRNNIYKI